jgi:hypothetical protein
MADKCGLLCLFCLQPADLKNMESNKKNYLFRIGPLIFFPKTPGPKQLPYQDNFEFWHNMLRIMVIVLYNPIILYFLFQARTDARAFLFSMDDWPDSRFVFFFGPLVLALIDLYLVRLEKKSGVPMQRVSKHFIYASWTVSLLFYGIIIIGLFS